MRQPEHAPDTKAALARLWDRGLSASKIAKELGLTKNQVMGLRFRMGLPSRPSPIKATPGRQRRPAREPELVVPLPPPAPNVAAAAGLPSTPTSQTCQWFARDNDGPFRDEDKCGRPTVPHRPYCETHLKRAYVKRSDIEHERAA